MADEPPLAELLCRMTAALDRMEALPRRVFELHCMQGLDFAEIAAALDIGLADVERELAAAMLHLLRHTGAVGRP